MSVWLYTLGSIAVVSLVSLIGVLAFPLREAHLRKLLLYFVSFAAGGLFADAFIHLIPEATSKSGFGIDVSLSVLSGIIVSFVVERFFQWRHCHIPTSKNHPHSFAYMNLFGDAIHNFIDGLILGGSYMADPPLGIATTLAVVLHEIPQEIGDFGVLIHGGFSRTRAVLFNFCTALTALLGGVTALSLGTLIHGFAWFLVSFAAGSFIYIAGSDLIPELRKEEPQLSNSAMQLMAFVFGILILLSLVYLE